MRVAITDTAINKAKREAAKDRVRRELSDASKATPYTDLASLFKIWASRPVTTSQTRLSPAARQRPCAPKHRVLTGWRGPERMGRLTGVRPGQQGPRHAAPEEGEQTTVIVHDQVSNVHPGIPAMGGRTTRTGWKVVTELPPPSVTVTPTLYAPSTA